MSQIVPFSGPQYIYGNAIALADTNSANVTIRRINYQLSNMTNSATMATGQVYLSTSPNSISGALLLGTFTNFGGANFSTNFAASYTNPPLYIILSFGDGTNTVGVIATYGP